MKEKIYPHLPVEPSAPVNHGSPDYVPRGDNSEVHNSEKHNYRLQKINEIEHYLQNQSEARRILSKKYHRANKIVNTTDGVLSTAAIGLGVTGVALLTTVIAAPIVLIMEGVSIGTGFLSVLAKITNKKLQTKEDKHRRIYILAESKLNSIHNHVSKAITDGYISDEEFSLVLEEAEKYREMKEKLRKENNQKLKDIKKESIFEKGNNEVREKYKEFFLSELVRSSNAYKI